MYRQIGAAVLIRMWVKCPDFLRQIAITTTAS